MVIRSIGLDIGTASSSAVLFEQGLTEDITVSQDDVLFLPSDLVVEDNIWSLTADRKDQTSTIPGIKRMFGSDIGEPRLTDYYNSRGVQVSLTDNLELRINNVSEFELASLLFKKYLELMPLRLQGIDGFGIAYPGYAPLDKVNKYHDAYQAASKSPVIMVSESEALAAYFSFRNWVLPGQKVAIVNVGASQTWASIVYFDKDKNYQVIHEIGDAWLGGEEINRCMGELVNKEMSERLSESEKAKIPNLLSRILIESESAKVNYSDRTSEFSFVFPFLFMGDNGVPYHFKFLLPNDQVIGALEEPLSKIGTIASRVLTDANFTHYDIDRLFMVGGQAKFLPIQMLLSSPVPNGGIFGRKANLVYGKVEIACGAAIVANMNIGSSNLPQSLDKICGEKLPQVLAGLSSELWASACEFLSTYSEIQTYPVPLQVKLINAGAKFGFDQTMGVLHDHGENGIDEALAEKEEKKSSFDWFFKS